MDDLPACSAWRDKFHRICRNRHRAEALFRLGDCLEQGCALGADGQAKGARFDVAAGVDLSGLRQEGGADPEPGIW